MQVTKTYPGTSTAPVQVKLGRTALILKRGGRLRDDGYHFNVKQVSSEFVAFAAYRAMGVHVPSAALYECEVADGEEKCDAMILLTDFIDGAVVNPDVLQQTHAIAAREFFVLHNGRLFRKFAL